MSADEKVLRIAVHDGNIARQELAVGLANAFRAAPGSFDPRSLERLGTVGMQTFLLQLGQRTAASRISKRGAPRNAAGSEAAAPTPSPAPARAYGWRDLRGPERHYIIAGIVAGLRAGTVVAVLGTFGLVAYERVLPSIIAVLS